MSLKQRAREATATLTNSSKRHIDNFPKPSLEGILTSRSTSTNKTPADEAIEFFESPVHDKDEVIRVYELELDADGGPSKNTSYIRLPPPTAPYILRVSLDAGTPASNNGVFKTNFPLDGGKFNRHKFLERKLPSDPSKPIKIDLPISHAGAFIYWMEYDTSTGRVKGREGYFNIDPLLRVKKRSSVLPITKDDALPKNGSISILDRTVTLPLDGLVVLTVVSKWMGTIDNWKECFQEASQRGYNMLHFTPLQQRGASNSPYSLASQTEYDRTLFPSTWKGTSEAAKQELAGVLKMARDDYGLLSLTDIVLNHTANNCEWLVEHPEAGFSPFNTPHLRPAFEIDNAIMEFSAELESKGLPTLLNSTQDLDRVMASLKEALQGLNLWQYYVLDSVREKKDVLAALDSADPSNAAELGIQPEMDVVTVATTLRNNKAIQGESTLADRFCVKVDSAIAAAVTKAAFVHLKSKEELAEAWVRVVDVLNVDLYKEANGDLEAALTGIRDRVKYTRLDEHGLRLGKISAKMPLVEPYFTRIPRHEKNKHLEASALAVANNGWIWDADPLLNFALLPSKSYLRREVIVWGDCVKLRYGDGPESNPWLWEYMTKYVENLAAQFDGFRIDNCHSTPLHVGVALLDAARVVNPDLYVCAELFTGSEETDTYFVSRLGINSLIREAYNAWDPKEFSRILYRNGVNKPIGSMDAACLTSPDELVSPTGKGPSRPCTVTPIQGSIPHALLFDVTHDNESPLHKRSAEDALSTAALVAFSDCAIGSNKGFDDLYPKLLDLVGEKRLYEIGGASAGIGRAKQFLNHLHTEMVLDGYGEAHVHQENDYIVMHRVHPSTGMGYLTVAHTAFNKGSSDRGFINPIKLAHTNVRYIFGTRLLVEQYDAPVDPNVIRGMQGKLIDLPAAQVNVSKDAGGVYSEIIVPDQFPPGCIMVFATQMEGLSPDIDAFLRHGVDECVADLDLIDMNVLLYRTDGEERDNTAGADGVYNIPGLGKIVYCGLEGWMHPLRHVMKHNDLSHPLAGHLRSGTWAMDYIQGRLAKQASIFPHLAKPAQWLKEKFDKIKVEAPSFLRPKLFAVVVYELYKTSRRAAIEQMSDFVHSGDKFTQDLALCSVQMHGKVPSASLDPSKAVPALAAGLPHFSSGWARTWGRDVFISLRGLFLMTGNYDAARAHILAFCSTLKHGLIPNLLDSVRTPRYNSRDSPWWMLQNIQDYCTFAPNGVSILSQPVKRRFPKDDTFIAWNDPKAYSYTSTVAEIIHEILQRHASGISFREYNAGPNLDMQMKQEGFQIDIRVDWSSGFIYGGNEFNCGTWMDKMGESEKAGSKGLPGTPRDGAPIEITGLLKSTLRWVSGLDKKVFPFEGVETETNGKKRMVLYKEWNDLLQKSFERYYYVPLDASSDSSYEIRSNLVNKRGIYKDVVGSGPGREWSDYQLRCNFPIAMVVAPELFNPEHAIEALWIADTALRGPLGMKTLDAADAQYRGYYDNSNDSTDPSVAKGRNYHQGPEWGWPLGYFLQAYLYFDIKSGTPPSNTLHKLTVQLLESRRHIRSDPWAGLPELTNEKGQFCYDSCPTQAWSSSTLLDFLHAARRIHKESIKK